MAALGWLGRAAGGWRGGAHARPLGLGVITATPPPLLLPPSQQILFSQQVKASQCYTKYLWRPEAAARGDGGGVQVVATQVGPRPGWFQGGWLPQKHWAAAAVARQQLGAGRAAPFSLLPVPPRSPTAPPPPSPTFTAC